MAERLNLAGCCITNEAGDVLVGRHKVSEREIIYELPGTAIPEGMPVRDVLQTRLEQEFNLDVITGERIDTFEHRDGELLFVYQVFEGRLRNSRKLDDDKWRFVDMRCTSASIPSASMTGSPVLATYAEKLRWRIQDGDLPL